MVLTELAEAEAFLEARVARQQREAASAFDLSKLLFGKQLAFATDPSDFVTGLCSRRAGKSVGAAAKLLKGNIDKPQAPSLYFTLTRGSAKRIIWPTLLRLNAKYHLGYEPNESELVLKKNGEGRVYLTGADTRGEIEKWRGTAWGTVVGDEAQALPPFLRDAVEEVLEPSFMDHHGTLTLIGTPSAIPAGYFYECCTGVDQERAWSPHSWTCFENPHLPDPKAYLAKVLRRRGVAVDHPSIQREFFGKWALDPDALVFKWDAKRNGFEVLPEISGRWRYVIGVDFGHSDADAVALLAYNEFSPCTWLVDEWTLAKAGISPVMAKVQEFRDRVGKGNVTGIVCDPAGMGRKIITELQDRFKVPAEAADKTAKVAYIELLNDAMRAGRFFARPDGLFAHDAMLVEWNREKSTADRLVVSSKFHSDICDAVLYAFRESLAWTSKAPPKTEDEKRAELAAAIQAARTPASLEQLRKRQAQEMADYAKEMRKRQRELERMENTGGLGGGLPNRGGPLGGGWGWG